MRHKIKYLIASALIVVSLTGFIIHYFTKSDSNTLTIFQTTDIHAHMNDKNGGILKLAGLLKEQVLANGGYKNCLLIDCGDLFQGTFEGTETKGEIVIPVFNSMRFDAFIPGNHDFDFGKNIFVRNSKELNCNISAANLSLKNTELAILPWKIYQKNEKRIAVIGMTNPNVKYWLWGDRYEGIEISPMEQVLKKIMPEVLRSNPDLIILAAHQGLYQAKRYPKGSNLKEIANKYPQIDIIFGGHSHTNQCGKILGGNTVYIQAGCHGKYLAKVGVFFKGRKKCITTELLPTIKSDNVSKIYNKKLEDLKKQKLTKVNLKSNNNSIELITYLMQKTAKSDIAVSSSYKPKMLYEKITVIDIYKLVPYEDNIVKIYLTYEQLRKVIQEQYDYQKNHGKYKNLFVSGCNVRIDSSGQISLIKFEEE